MKQTNSKAVNFSITIVTIAIMVIVSIFLYSFLSKRVTSEQTNDAQVSAYINPVSARAGGYIQSIRFEENQVVNKGDTLLILDDREYRLKIKEAEAGLNNAEAQLASLNAAIKTARAGTEVSKDHIDAAKTRLWQQQQDIDRYRKLLTEEAVTGQQYEQVKAKYDIANSDYSASKNALATSFAQIRELTSKSAILEAVIKDKQTQLKFAHLNLSYTAILAPYNGRVGRRQINEGMQIKPGQPLVNIIQEDNKWITANFKETQVAGMQIGQAVNISIDGLPNHLFHGVIESISGATGSSFSLLPADNSTGNFVRITQRIPVKIRFTDKDLRKVRVGMNASVTIKK